MRRSAALALAAVLLVAVFVRLSPLLSALYWGSDIGEYYALLRALDANGAMPSHYIGWGITYPFFPGTFFLQDAFAKLGAVGLPAVLDLVVPVLGAVAVVLVFLIAAKVADDDRAALLAAAFVAVAMPHAYATSHTAPATLGDLLVFACLLLFLRLRSDARALVLLLPASAALVTVHHLSAYFLLVMALGATILRSLVRPAAWTPGLRREVVFEVVYAGMMFAFWFGYATPFRDNLLHAVNVQPWWAPFAAFPVLVLVVVLLVWLRRVRPWRYRPRTPTAPYAITMFLVAVAVEFAILGSAVLASIPGTGIALSWTTVLIFAPVLVLAAFAAAGRKASDFSRYGVDVSGWFLVLVASTGLGTVVATEVLIPYRHLEYVIVPLAILGGLGLVHTARIGLEGRARRTWAVAGVMLLLAAGFATAIPPPAVLGGWNEGVSATALNGAYWSRDHVTGLVAADHRASTVLFGFASVNGTWDTTSAPFFAPDFTAAEPGLVSVATPSGGFRVSYVWVDRDEAAGVQLHPWDPANPMPGPAVAKFSDAPFVKVFDDGYAQVYWIDWGLAP